MEKKNTNYLMEFGLIFVFLSTQIANVYRLYTGKPADIAPWIISLAMLCMVNTRNPFRLNKKQALLILYQIYIFVFATMSGTTLMQPGDGTIYILFIIAFILVSATAKTIYGDKVPYFMWIVTGILNIMLTLYFSLEEIERFNAYSVNGVLLADRSVLATIGYFHLLAALTFKTEKKITILLKGILIAASCYNIMVTLRRGMFVTLLIILVLHICLTFHPELSFKLFLRAAMAAVIVYILYLTVPYIHRQIDSAIESVVNSVHTLLGKETSNQDISALIRAQNRTHMLEEIKNFTLRDWLIGKGYNMGWIDFPFLQCFYDMGIFGGTLYIVTQLMPFRYLFTRKRRMKNYEKLFFYLFIISFVNNFYSGFPYGMAKFIYIIPLLADWRDEEGRAV